MLAEEFGMKASRCWRLSTSLVYFGVTFGSHKVDRFVHIPVSLQGSPAGTVWAHKFQLPRWLHWPAWEEMMVYMILSESGVYCTLSWFTFYAIPHHTIQYTSISQFISLHKSSAGWWVTTILRRFGMIAVLHGPYVAILTLSHQSKDFNQQWRFCGLHPIRTYVSSGLKPPSRFDVPEELSSNAKDISQEAVDRIWTHHVLSHEARGSACGATCDPWSCGGLLCHHPVLAHSRNVSGPNGPRPTSEPGAPASLGSLWHPGDVPIFFCPRPCGKSSEI